MHQIAPHGSVWLHRSHAHVKKRKFSSQIRTWKLRDPATANQFQSAFKVETMTSAAAVATAVGADADTANRLVKAEGPFAGCCH